MPTLYLLCGMPFSGKTTLGKAITRHIDSEYISLDEINEARNLCGGDGISIEEWEETHALAREKLQMSMLSQRDIVLDDTSCFRWLRNRFRDLATKHNYQTMIVFLDLPLTEIWSRMKKNRKTQTRHQVKPSIVQEMAKTFEFPQADEKVIRYTIDQSVEKWLTSFLDNIKNQ